MVHLDPVPVGFGVCFLAIGAYAADGEVLQVRFKAEFIIQGVAAIVLNPADSASIGQAIKKANEFNIGWCKIFNMTHAGAVGYFALRAAKAGLAGLVMTASQPMMAYPGSTKNVVSTNPIAIAVPGD